MRMGQTRVDIVKRNILEAKSQLANNRSVTVSSVTDCYNLMETPVSELEAGMRKHISRLKADQKQPALTRPRLYAEGHNKECFKPINNANVKTVSQLAKARSQVMGIVSKRHSDIDGAMNAAKKKFDTEFALEKEKIQKARSRG